MSDVFDFELGAIKKLFNGENTRLKLLLNGIHWNVYSANQFGVKSVLESEIN